MGDCECRIVQIDNNFCVKMDFNKRRFFREIQQIPLISVPSALRFTSAHSDISDFCAVQIHLLTYLYLLTLIPVPYRASTLLVPISSSDFGVVVLRLGAGRVQNTTFPLFPGPGYLLANETTPKTRPLIIFEKSGNRIP